jgi:hypothetical protein
MVGDIHSARPPTLQQGADEQLHATVDGRTTIVTPTRCFPWTHPASLISLRDAAGHEVALIDATAALDPASRAALEAALRDSGYMIEVTGIDSIDEEFELRCWRVVTPHGARTFQTRRDEWPRQVATGAFVIRDLSGDLYVIRQPAHLDARSRLQLACHVD